MAWSAPEVAWLGSSGKDSASAASSKERSRSLAGPAPWFELWGSLTASMLLADMAPLAPAALSWATWLVLERCWWAAAAAAAGAAGEWSEDGLPFCALVADARLRPLSCSGTSK